MKLFSRRNKKIWTITLMMMPGTIWLILLRYIPMGGIIMAFQDYRPNPQNPTLISNIIHSRFVGLANFRFIFATDRAALMIRNTLGYNAVFIILTTILSVGIAICLSELSRKFIAKLYQTMMFFPFFISWVVAGYFVFAFLDPTFGMLSGVREWYFDATGWPVILTSAHLWKSLGFNSIVYLAAISGIDQGMYEAAAIDGASKWKQVWSITIPSIKPMIIILFILAVGRIFNADFGLFYQIPRNMGPLQSVTEVIDTYVYRVMTSNIAGATGMATAAGLFQNVIGFICIMATNTLVRRFDNENSLF